MNETQSKSVPPSKSTTWLIGLVVVAIIVVAGIIFLLLKADNKKTTNTNQTSNSVVNNSTNTTTNQTGNTNTLVNQPVDTNSPVTNTNALPVNTNTTPTNTANPDEVSYQNSEFGYSVRYLNPNGTRSTSSTSNTAESLFSQWVLSENNKAVITIQVFPIDKITEVFSARKYAKTDATVPLAKITSKVLTVEGAKRGLTFDYGTYVFVLLASDKQGTSLYTEFETIAKTLAF